MAVTAHFGARVPDALPLLHSLGASVALIAAMGAGCLWIFGAQFAPLPSRGDLRLSEAARHLGLPVEETIMRAIDAGLPRLTPGGNQ